MDKHAKVCITGVTGYLGSWVLKTMIDSVDCSFQLRGTVRDKENKEQMDQLQSIFGDKFDDIEFVEMDLTKEETIGPAIEGCDYVVHIASPYPNKNPKDPKTVIEPAVGGTKEILRAWLSHKVQRLVVTSSVATVIDFSKFEPDKTYDENDWLELNGDTLAYPKSKTLAEREVLNFYENLTEEDKFDIVVLNPGFLAGPILTKHKFTSQDTISKVLLGKYPGLPNIHIPIVDVRDVAEAHLRALIKKPPSGRYILVQNVCEFVDIGKILTDEFSQFKYEPSNQTLGYWTAKIAAWFIPEAQTILNQWSKKIQVSSQKARDELDTLYIPYQRSIVDMGYSLLDNGYVPDQRPQYEES